MLSEGLAEARTERSMTRKIKTGTSLDALFEGWEATYPEARRGWFHRDGIIDEVTFRHEAHRLLFVLLEPNSREGAYDRFLGWDLRIVVPDLTPRKEVTVNLGLWARALLDGATDPQRPDPATTARYVRRIALMNLKKVAGRGVAEKIGIGIFAWRDRELLRAQFRLVNPTIAIACGADANRLLGVVLHDDPFWEPVVDEPWEWERVPVLPAKHPSVRPYQAADALDRLAQMAKKARAGAFAGGEFGG